MFLDSSRKQGNQNHFALSVPGICGPVDYVWEVVKILYPAELNLCETLKPLELKSDFALASK